MKTKNYFNNFIIGFKISIFYLDNCKVILNMALPYYE